MTQGGPATRVSLLLIAPAEQMRQLRGQGLFPWFLRTANAPTPAGIRDAYFEVAL
jgi:hypothetical protein